MIHVSQANLESEKLVYNKYFAISQNTPKGTQLYIHQNPTFENQKLFIFDFIWTIVKPNEGRKIPLHKDDWTWLRSSVPIILLEISKKYQIVFLVDINPHQKFMIDMIKNVCFILELNIIVLIANQKKYHKPNILLFESVFSSFNKSESCVIANIGGSRILEGVDKDLASNIDVEFKTPEDIFPFDEIKEIKGDYEDKMNKEIVIMVGMPGSGKSTFCQNNLSNYHLISGDTYKTQKKMIEQAEKYIKTKSVIFDGTNGTIQKRKLYVDFAKNNHLYVKCIWINRPVEMAFEQIKRRKVEGGHYIPQRILTDYSEKFEIPTEEEGFQLFEV